MSETFSRLGRRTGILSAPSSVFSTLPICLSSAHPPMMTKASEKWAIEKLHHSGTQPPTHSLASHVCMHASKGDECKNAGMDGWAERALEVLEGVSSQHPSLAFLRKMDHVFASPYARDSLSVPCPFPNKVICYLLRVLPSLYLGGEAKTWRMQEMDCPQMTISV